MELRLERTYKGPQYTIGHLYINNEFFCDTIEDVDRGITQDMPFTNTKNNTGYWTDKDGNKIQKVYGETAIPTGVYEITLTYSSKFKKILPILLKVNGFDGVRIHSGNTQKDSLGCIIVGENKAKGQVLNSRNTMNRLMPLLEKAIENKETIKISIK